MLGLAAEILRPVGKAGLQVARHVVERLHCHAGCPLSPTKLRHRRKYDAVNDLFMKDAEAKGVPLPNKRVRPGQ